MFRTQLEVRMIQTKDGAKNQLEGRARGSGKQSVGVRGPRSSAGSCPVALAAQHSPRASVSPTDSMKQVAGAIRSAPR